MRNLFFSAILAAGLVLAAAPASAIDFLGSGLASGMSGQVGVSSHINKAPVYDPFGLGVRDRHVYERDAAERRARDHRVLKQNDDLLAYPAASITPAAGAIRNIPPSARVMGGIQGGYSYND